MSRRKKPDPFSALRPAAESFWAVFDGIQNATQEQLDELERQAMSVTNANCWCAIYDAAKYMAPIIASEKQRRLRNAMDATTTWQP